MVPVLRFLLILFALVVLAPAQASRQRFYPDDPIWEVPAPKSVAQIKQRDVNALYDFTYQSFRSKERLQIPSGGINTLGEVPDSEWFTNRHAKKRMTRDELQRGPGNENRPVAPFVVSGAKTEGITPGFSMQWSMRSGNKISLRIAQ